MEETAMEKDKIIIIEDSKFQGRIIRDILTNSGYDVTWVKSAEEAISEDLYQKFDLIVLDVILPGINGYEFCEHIKKRSSLIPVIMVTSMDQEKNLIKALNSGADDYIRKPFSVNELLARIKVQLRTRRLQLELVNKNIELQKANETIKKLAVTDMLTKTYNRTYIREFLEKTINRSKNDFVKIACIMIDIDNFKKVNDTYGHLTGDIVLANAANICKLAVEDNGAVIRFGGEEFLIIVNEDVNKTSSIAEKVRNDCENSNLCKLKFTVSLGVSRFNLHKDSFIKDFEDGLKDADAMLYVSKNSGKNKVTIKEKIHTA
jgi:two-component system, cell cycle response regulator